MAEIKSKLNYLRIAPRKVRVVADLIKGLPVEEAEAQLLLNSRRPSKQLLKALRSSMANAKNNFKIDENSLYVKNIRVDKGPVLKRMMPRAMGRGTLIEKKMSHVTIILEKKEKPTPPRFIITREKPKTEEKKKTKSEKASDQKKTEKEEKSKVPTQKEGAFKKFFRRKSV